MKDEEEEAVDSESDDGSSSSSTSQTAAAFDPRAYDTWETTWRPRSVGGVDGEGERDDLLGGVEPNICR